MGYMDRVEFSSQISLNLKFNMSYSKHLSNIPYNIQNTIFYKSDSLKLPIIYPMRVQEICTSLCAI